MRLAIAAVGAALLAALCVPAPAAGLAPDPAPVDDAAFQRDLTRAVIALRESHKLTPIDTLRGQLSRRTAGAALPRLPAPAAARDPAVVYARARESVLVMCELYKCGKCSEWHVSCSTCFAIAPDIVVLNHHAFTTNRAAGITESMAVATADGRVFPVREILAASPTDDAAAVRIDGGPLPPLPLSADAPAGADVFVVSHPAGMFYTLTRGIVSRHYVDGGGRKGPGVPRLAITADFAKGSSGGPVFNSAGAVVGMVASTRSIYYDEKSGEQRNLQMVVKNCVPARSILALFEAP